MEDRSYGIIPLRLHRNGWEVFLVQHQAGHWAFPKGHVEEGETPLQTAERELYEETGLSVVRYLHDQPFQESYFFTYKKKLIHKTVLYFMAEVTGQVKLQEVEISGSQWISIDRAAEIISFEEGKKICAAVREKLN